MLAEPTVSIFKTNADNLSCDQLNQLQDQFDDGLTIKFQSGEMSDQVLIYSEQCGLEMRLSEHMRHSAPHIKATRVSILSL